jgi:hypothetical protein
VGEVGLDYLGVQEVMVRSIVWKTDLAGEYGTGGGPEVLLTLK